MKHGIIWKSKSLTTTIRHHNRDTRLTQYKQLTGRVKCRGSVYKLKSDVVDNSKAVCWSNWQPEYMSETVQQADKKLLQQL